MTRVAVILVNWNGWRDTLECLESLRDITGTEHRVIVCDNGSTDESLVKLTEWAEASGLDYCLCGCEKAEAGGEPADDPQLVLIRIGENRGFAGGNNVGIRYGLAQGCFDYFWLLNNDTVVTPDSLTRLVERMAEDARIGLCGSTILEYRRRDKILALGGGHYVSCLGVPWHHGKGWRYGRKDIDWQLAEVRMNYVEGASMLVSRRFVEQVGLMNEEYFLYFEEADWAERGRDRFRLGYAPLSIVYHKVGASIGTSRNPARKSYVCDYYNIRNRIRFTRNYYPAALPTVGLVLLFEALIRLLCGKADRAAMILRLMVRGGADLEDRP